MCSRHPLKVLIGPRVRTLHPCYGPNLPIGLLLGRNSPRMAAIAGGPLRSLGWLSLKVAGAPDIAQSRTVHATHAPHTIDAAHTGNTADAAGASHACHARHAFPHKKAQHSQKAADHPDAARGACRAGYRDAARGATAIRLPRRCPRSLPSPPPRRCLRWRLIRPPRRCPSWRPSRRSSRCQEPPWSPPEVPRAHHRSPLQRRHGTGCCATGTSACVGSRVSSLVWCSQTKSCIPASCNRIRSRSGHARITSGPDRSSGRSSW